MILGNPLLGRDVPEHSVLMQIVSAHSFFSRVGLEAYIYIRPIQSGVTHLSKLLYDFFSSLLEIDSVIEQSRLTGHHC
jgi:hypothetical protein